MRSRSSRAQAPTGRDQLAATCGESRRRELFRASLPREGWMVLHPALGRPRWCGPVEAAAPGVLNAFRQLLGLSFSPHAFHSVHARVSCREPQSPAEFLAFRLGGLAVPCLDHGLAHRVANPPDRVRIGWRVCSQFGAIGRLDDHGGSLLQRLADMARGHGIRHTGDRGIVRQVASLVVLLHQPRSEGLDDTPHIVWSVGKAAVHALESADVHDCVGPLCSLPGVHEFRTTTRSGR